MQPPTVTNAVRFNEQPITNSSVDTSMQSSKGIKELSAEDKLKIANLIKELARYKIIELSIIWTNLNNYFYSIGHEKEIVENKLSQERTLFELQMKKLLVDYDKLMKDNQSRTSACILVF